MQIKWCKSKMCLKKNSKVGQKFFSENTVQHWKNMTWKFQKYYVIALSIAFTCIRQIGLKADAVNCKLQWFSFEVVSMLLRVKLYYMNGEICLFSV